ncbi:MBL fold metallo-hydrolase [Desulfoluna spongiiphila]|uniref:MBL fold metallo-hydrolase n=1 Tax=Desulfoluna spongiiphila TaxID=419481 RepID=UPI001255721F|nr:MBL fold metallo-hydrolase [Desulfoluna spongiiphila]VVS93075.1 metallo-beta-lactamase [Desulfoluna spongiiphila]
MAGYEKMAPGVFRIRQEVRKGWVPFAMNLYALPGTDGLLFDAGSGTKGAVAHVARSLKDLERETGSRVRQILPSHAHWDHFSGASALADKRPMRVLLTEAMVPLVRTRACYRAAYREGTSALRPRAGALNEACRALGGRLIDEAFSLSMGIRAVTGPFSPLAVGDHLATDAGTWEVLAGPGHCDAHIMLWNAETGILLGGDNVLSHITTWLGPPRSDLVAYRKTLETIRELPGLRLILPAHGRPVTDPVKRTTQLIAHRKKRLTEIREKVEAAGPRGLTGRSLVRHYYPRMAPLKRSIAQGWIEATLLYLLQEGDVARTAEKGLWRYHPL